jgi:hypothetical protein
VSAGFIIIDAPEGSQLSKAYAIILRQRKHLYS